MYFFLTQLIATASASGYDKGASTVEFVKENYSSSQMTNELDGADQPNNSSSDVIFI